MIKEFEATSLREINTFALENKVTVIGVQKWFGNGWKKQGCGDWYLLLYTVKE